MVQSVPPEQEVAIAFAGALFYGIYLLTFAHAIRWQLFSDEGWSFRKVPRWSLVVITIVICGLVTTYIALGTTSHIRQLQSDLSNVALPTGPPPWSWMTAVICISANSTALLADTVLIYRCWIVYKKSTRIIIFPTFMWIGGIVCTILQAIWQLEVQPLNQGLWTWVNMSVGPGIFLLPFWGSTLALNLYAMSAIIYKIQTVAKSTGSSGITMRSTVALLIESGVLYFSATFVHFIVWLTPDNMAIRVASEINVPVIGIAFNLILIRVGQKRVWAQEKATREYMGIIIDSHTAAEGGQVHVKKQEMLTFASASTTYHGW